jgi:hypothetical protein
MKKKLGFLAERNRRRIYGAFQIPVVSAEPPCPIYLRLNFLMFRSGLAPVCTTLHHFALFSGSFGAHLGFRITVRQTFCDGGSDSFRIHVTPKS